MLEMILSNCSGRASFAPTFRWQGCSYSGPLQDLYVTSTLWFSVGDSRVPTLVPYPTEVTVTGNYGDLNWSAAYLSQTGKLHGFYRARNTSMREVDGVSSGKDRLR